MLRGFLIFLWGTLVAGILGFGRVGAAGITQIQSIIFLVSFFASPISGRERQA